MTPAPTPVRPSDLESWLDRHGQSLDIALAVLAFITLGLISIVSIGVTGTWPTVATVLASCGIPAALAFRRRWPVGSAVVVNALALLHFLAEPQLLLPIDLLIYVSVYSTTVHGPLWARRLSLGSAILGSGLVALTVSDIGRETLPSIVFSFVGISALAVIAWALGLLRRSTRARTESLRERAARLEFEREQQMQIAAAAERARIAREMHDVVAHSLSIVVAQADGGRYAAQHDPAVAIRSLETIATTGRTALADMRRILGVLRDGGDVLETAPQPDTEGLEALVTQVRDAGYAVDLVRTGAPVPLPTGMGLAVYRICQEALTNAMKYAGPADRVRIRVDVAWHPGALVLQIDDDGRGLSAESDGAGQGHVGMRERVALFGGTLWNGPRPGGGYRVHVTFPVQQASREGVLP